LHQKSRLRPPAVFARIGSANAEELTSVV